MNSSLTLRPRPRRGAKRRWWASQGCRPHRSGRASWRQTADGPCPRRRASGKASRTARSQSAPACFYALLAGLPARVEASRTDPTTGMTVQVRPHRPGRTVWPGRPARPAGHRRWSDDSCVAEQIRASNVVVNTNLTGLVHSRSTRTGSPVCLARERRSETGNQGFFRVGLFGLGLGEGCGKGADGLARSVHDLPPHSGNQS